MIRRQFLFGFGSALAIPLAKVPHGKTVLQKNELNVGDFVGSFGYTGTAVQHAIDTAIHEGIPSVRLPAPGSGRAYDIGATIQNDGVQLVGSGPHTVLRKTGKGSCFISGRIPNRTAVPLTVNLYSQAAKLKTADFPGVQFKVGSVYIFTSEAHCHPNTPAHCGEFVIVQSITKDTVVLRTPMMFDYYVHDTAHIQEMHLTTGVGYSDFGIEMDPAVVPAGAMTRFDNYGIQFDFCRSPLVTDVSVSNGVAAGIRLLGCLDARITKYQAFNLGSAEDDGDGTSSVGLGGYGYGIAERGLNRGLIVDHAVTE
jgi:hypothetical protein